MVAVTCVRQPTTATSMHYTCLCGVLWHLVLVCVSCPSINVEQGIQAGTFRQACTAVNTAYVVGAFLPINEFWVITFALLCYFEVSSLYCILGNIVLDTKYLMLQCKC